jgi:hypothetical protein
MRAHEFITETPISDFQTFGTVGPDDNPLYFRKEDEKLLNSSKAVNKIIDAFNKTPFNFNIYILLSNSFNKKSISALRFTDTKKLLDIIQNTIGHKMETKNNITMIYTNNIQSPNHMPMNAWTLAHRVGHALQITKGNDSFRAVEINVINEFLKACNSVYKEITYGNPINWTVDLNSTNNSPLGVDINEHGKTKTLKDIATNLLTTRAGRRNLLNNVHIELYCELIAQYLITGRVRMNKEFSNQETIAVIQECEKNINDALANMFASMVGRVFSF